MSIARGKNYTTAAINTLLDLVEELLPVGGDEWNRLASIYNNRTKESRSGDDLKGKFKSLRSTKKGTGEPNCPPEVARAKRLFQLLELRMDVQDCSSNQGNNMFVYLYRSI